MSRSGPMGSLGGGGWEEAPRNAPPNTFVDNSKESKRRDKVLADMYEMFLDSVEPEIIQSVVYSCNFHHKKCMDALLDMCGTKTPDSAATQSSRVPSPQVQSSRVPSPQVQSSRVPPPQVQSSRAQPMWNVATPLSSLQSPTASAKNNSSQGVEPPKNYSSVSATPRTNSFSMQKPVKPTQTIITMDKMKTVRCYIEHGQRIMILMRGCPGSGKSYLAEGLILTYGGKPKDYVFSTDDYFMKRNGFNFQPAQLSDAHQWNQTRVLKKVREGLSPVIVDNTNTQLWEMTNYASMAINYGYLIEILEPDTAWFSKLDELARRNKHGVPRDKLKMMLDRYERGISVDDLIKSTGANYSRLPPQPAEYSLVSPMPNRPKNTNPLTTLNAEQRATSKEPNTIAQNFQLNFSPKSISSMGLQDANLTSQVEPKQLSGGEGFYFGQNASSSLKFYSLNKEENSASSLNPFHSLKKSNSTGSDIFTQNFKTGFEPTTGGSEFVSSENTAASSNEVIPISKNISEFLMPFTQIANKAEESGSGILASVEKNNSLLVNISEESDKNTLSHQALQYFNDTVGAIALPANSLDSQECTSIKQEMVDSKSGDNSCNEQKADLWSTDGNSSFPSSSNWIGAADWNTEEDENQTNDAIEENPLPKPPRPFNVKKMRDYCQSVKNLNATSPNESSGWTFCEDNLISWQPIDKMQQGTLTREASVSPSTLSDTSQRFKFTKNDVQDKETNTHHADFCTLNQVSSNGSADGIVVLNAYYRDINEGRPVSDYKIPVKVKLDKGTLTENDFEVDLKAESKQEKIKELSRLFSNKSTASLKELLKQCDWDVNYVSNLLLDETDNEALSTSFIGDDDVDSDSEEESSTQETTEENTMVTIENVHEEPIGDDRNSPNTQDAEEVKRHIELSIDFDKKSYSPHLLSIKNFRRGLREGAIPKLPVSEDPLATSQGLAEYCKEPTPEPSHSPSESSDADEQNETLEFIVDKDFVQQLADKFGGSLNVADVSPVVKFPVTLARQIYDIIFSPNEEEDGDFAMKLQCEEDERMARRLYEDMLSTHAGHQADSSPPQLREIMDMELAQAIYKADVDSLSRNSQDTAANVLAKRLLEENYSKIDKKTLHDVYACCNYSFEDTVKTLQEALSSDGQDFGEKGPFEREQVLFNRAQQANIKGGFVGSASLDTFNDGAEAQRDDAHRCCHSIEDSIETDNPWDLSDPKAYYNKYRAKADEYLKERDEMYRKANEAFKRQQRSVAAYYAKLGELNGKKYTNASAMAAASLAAAQADSLSDTLDLHNFKVVEAVIVFDLFIDFQIRLLSERGASQESLNIITGRGSHSVNGKPRIKPAIINRAKKRNLRCQPLQNPGVIRVYVTVDSKPSHEID